MLSAGSPVELEIEADEVASIFEGTIVIATDKRVAVMVPLSRRSPDHVRPGGTARVHLAHGATIESFSSTITSLTREPGLLIVALMPPTSLDQKRREYYRLVCRIPIDVASLEDETTVRTETVDISGGGLGLLSPRRFARHEPVDLTIHFGDGAPVAAEARVANAYQLAETGRRPYRIGLDYTQIGVRDRNRLTNFVFAKQRELRRRGLL